MGLASDPPEATVIGQHEVDHFFALKTNSSVESAVAFMLSLAEQHPDDGFPLLLAGDAQRVDGQLALAEQNLRSALGVEVGNRSRSAVLGAALESLIQLEVGTERLQEAWGDIGTFVSADLPLSTTFVKTACETAAALDSALIEPSGLNLLHVAANQRFLRPVVAGQVLVTIFACMAETLESSSRGIGRTSEMANRIQRYCHIPVAYNKAVNGDGPVGDLGLAFVKVVQAWRLLHGVDTGGPLDFPDEMFDAIRYLGLIGLDELRDAPPPSPWSQ